MRKHLFIILILSLTFTSLQAQKAEINSKGFFIKGTRITKATTMADVQTILGRPDRISPLANIIWTYDTLGIYIYFASADSMLKHISFDLVKHHSKFSPAFPFKSSFVIHNNAVNRNSSLAKLKRIKSLKFEEDPVYLNPAYTSDVKIFFEFDDTKTALRYAGVALDFKRNDD